MHSYIVGTTGSGKSHLAKSMARGYREAGYSVLALDPVRDPEWAAVADHVTADKDEFLRVFWESANCKVFVDETLRVTDNHDKEFHATATMGRHNGHQLYYLAQRPSHIPVNIRSQCQTVFTFRQNRKESILMSDDFGNDDLRQAVELGKYEFLHATNFKCEKLIL